MPYSAPLLRVASLAAVLGVVVLSGCGRCAGAKFTVQELLVRRFPRKVSADVDVDPCKAEGFYGDIALPNVQYDEELEQQRRNQTMEASKGLGGEEGKAEGGLREGGGGKKGRRGRHKNKSGRVSKRGRKREGSGVGGHDGGVEEGRALGRRRWREGEEEGREGSRGWRRRRKGRLERRRRRRRKGGRSGALRHERVFTEEELHRGGESAGGGEGAAAAEGEEDEWEDVEEEEVGGGESSGVRWVRPKRGRRSVAATEGRRVARAATARKERVWDYGVIPYEIDANFSGAHKALFKQAMRHWENHTCVKFVERGVDHPNYILFTERPCGCCSFVGKRGNGAQAISIGKNCDKFGIVVHELGHVVGFWHEHTRPDRDNHVQIVRENIMAGQEYNFNKLTEEEVNSLGLPYDYDSIMHYAKTTFSKSTYLDTILPIEDRSNRRKIEIGQRVKLSEGDVAQTNLLYKCFRCGRTLQESAATFSSPRYPNSSPPSDGERCEWRITATHGERIVLNITELDLFKSDSCRSDYLEIRDGYWHKSSVIGRFCGSGRIHEPIVSTGSRMLVTYITSNRQNGHRGFTASYEAVCGGELDMENGHLESPNYPDDYQPSKECVWKITVPIDYQVALKFQSFEIENHDNCVYDYLEVRDGHDSSSPLIGVFCGYKVPPDIRSTSNKLLVKFVSDGSVQKAGFSAAFMKEFDECALINHGCQHHCINTLGGYECACKIGFELHSDGKHCEDACGGIFDASNGTITSPSFPEMYPGNKNCIWEIIAPPQYRITLNFTHFDLEGNNECEYDSVEVSSRFGEDTLRKHGIFCGSRLPPLITSEGNALRLTFTSDNSVQKSGFAAVFFTDMDECAINNGGCQHECRNTIGSYACSCHNGFLLHENRHDCKEGGCKYEVTAPLGSITSPNYPDYYPSRKDCVWHFTTTPGHRIKLVFHEFEMEPHQECAYDHVALYDGGSAESHTLGRFCGSKVPHPIVAASNQMYMVFKSDASVQRKGFFARHSTVCGGHLQATTQVKHLYSHSRFGDHNYENRADCDWVIEASPGFSVHLTFLTFEVEDEGDCAYDYVEVYSGLDTSGASYGRFCGNSNPTDIVSMTEALLVRFRSDDSIVSKGFSAAYVAMEPIEESEEQPSLPLYDGENSF